MIDLERLINNIDKKSKLREVLSIEKGKRKLIFESEEKFDKFIEGCPIKARILNMNSENFGNRLRVEIAHTDGNYYIELRAVKKFHTRSGPEFEITEDTLGDQIYEKIGENGYKVVFKI